MGGTLYLNNGGHPPAGPNRDTVCLSGYDSQKDNYALSNFYPGDNGNGFFMQDPHEGRLCFPTTEHYLHFQKLSPQGKKKYRLTFTDPSKSPKEILGIGKKISGTDLRAELRVPSGKWAGKTADAAWDRLCLPIQMQINATKYQQSAAFQDSIHEAQKVGRAFGDSNPSAATIIEDTASLGGSRPEMKWGTGPDGSGRNVLGNSQTAFANLLTGGYKPPKSPNALPRLGDFSESDGSAKKQVQQLFNAAEDQFKQGVQKSLIAARGGQSDTDTSDLGLARVQKFNHGQALPQAPSFKAVAPPLGTQAKKTRVYDKVTLPDGFILSPKDDASLRVHFDAQGHFQKATWIGGETTDCTSDKAKGWVKGAVKQANRMKEVFKPGKGRPPPLAHGYHAKPSTSPQQVTHMKPSSPHTHKLTTDSLMAIFANTSVTMTVTKQASKRPTEGDKFIAKTGGGQQLGMKVDSKTGGFDFKPGMSDTQKKIMVAAVQAEFGLPPSSRKPQPSKIGVPDSLKDSASINGVKGAEMDKGPFRTAIKLIFNSDKERDAAYDKFKEQVGNNVVKEPGGRLSVLGDEKAFDKIMKAVDTPALLQSMTQTQQSKHRT